jgi:hypothetical protein
MDNVFLPWQALLVPLHITRFFTDGWGAYERHRDPTRHTMGKAHMQKLESKHINLPMLIKRLVRRTICFSKNDHDVRSGRGPLHQSLCIWGSHLMRNQQICNTFENGMSQ